MPRNPLKSALSMKAEGIAMQHSQRSAQAMPQKREGSPLNSKRQGLVPAEPTTAAKPRSSHPFSQPPSREAKRLAKAASEEAYSFIQNLPCDGEEKEYLLNLLRTRAVPPWGSADHYPAVLGKTGQGKSHTIISLTGIDLGNAMGGTDSVTNTVMEFRPLYNDQKHPYLVQIFLYSKPYVMKMFEDGFRENRHWQSTHPESIGEDDSGDEDAEATEAPTRLIAMILDLKILGPDQGYRDHEAADQYLESIDDSKSLRSFGKRLDCLYKNIQGRDGITSKIEQGCATVEAVRKFIAPFIRKASEPFAEGTEAECCPYPLVEKVAVASNSPVLNKGNILKDAPGVGDTNRAHVDRAHTALKNADKIMVVSEMKRCLANNELYATIKMALKQRGPGGVILVLTHSAEIDEKIKKKTRGRFTREQRQTYASLQQQIAQVDAELLILKEQEENVDEITIKRELEEQIQGKKIRRKEIENTDFELHVLARNQQTVADFRGKLLSKKIWKKHYPKIIIVCIDNYEYGKHAPGYSSWTPDESCEAPRLSKEASGIPELRSIIAGFPADGLWETLRHHIHETWECTMNSLEMSGTVTIAQRKAEVDEQFAGSCQSIVTIIEEQFHDLTSGHMEAVRDHIVQKERSWAEAGLETHAGFAKSMNSATHKALMKKHGLTVTGQRKEFDLNEELYAEPRKVIMASLDDLSDDKIPRFFTELIQGIRSTVEELFTEIEHGPHYDAVGLSAKVQAGIRVRQRTLEKACTSTQKQAIRMIRDKRDRALGPHGTSSYFYAAFKSAYDTANTAQPKKRSRSYTLHDARCKAFEMALTVPDGPYYQLYIMMFEELVGNLNDLQQQLISNIKNIFAEIQHEIDMACSRKDDHRPEAKTFRREVMRQTGKLRKLFTDQIRPCLIQAVKMAEIQRREERINQQMPTV
ncbi:uncharacterized protein CC84DRAFT_1254727 [Paraphaeosphaeria sporulosa]|uniref:DUF7605 domain-containing protein n=1 Tax=Paraphaeosphaeria sporulosa TaxID=1460663 RepID=A0A177CZS5_9PLEO|nr:uncharacterized protein CC84DRAFT_1254727 [Paraphaeosphaeria sporulosa]OAG12477.1 hypothetical protein CC84DRAFT_1254727 [Paraphaeosphaeria sporulosa]